MKIHRDNVGNLNAIDSYDKDFVSIRGTRYTQSLVVSPLHLRELPELTSPEDLVYSNLKFILDWEPEVVLLGTGLRLTFPDMAVLQAFHQLDIGCDVMDSAAACRTYNILVGEGRTIAAVILIP